MIPELRTKRLYLRGWREADFGPYAALRTDPVLMAFVGGHRSPEQAREEFDQETEQWVRLGYGTFVAALQETDQAVGFAGLWHPEELHEPELCWSLFPEHTGKGYATEAAEAVLVWAGKELGLPPLMSFIHPDNRPSQAVVERLGAERQADTMFRGAPRRFYRHHRISR